MIRDCAAFESALAEALAEPSGAPPATLAPLEAHANACPACRPSLPLVALAASPAGERSPLPEPTAHDWARFDRRLAARLDAESSKGWRWGIAAVAAIAAGVLLGAWLLRAPEGTLIAEGSKPPSPPPKARPPKAPAPPAAEEPDPETEIDALRPDPWSARGLPDDDSDAPLDGPFPDLDRLDEDARERLLRWLDEEEARLSPRGEA